MDNFYKVEDIKDSYELVVLGAGPAGCTAGIYAARDAIDTLILEPKFTGGNLSITDTIENYPGYDEPISGLELATKFAQQAEKYGAMIRFGVPVLFTVDSNNNDKIISLETGKIIKAKSVIIATGSTAKKLNIEGEAAFIGRGVSFCATCDGGFYRGKKVIVIGGGNSALEEAKYLTKFASLVTLVHRREEFRAAKIEQDRVTNDPKIKLLTSSHITKIIGKDKIEAVMIQDLKTNSEYRYDTDGVFVYIGWDPNTAIFKDLITLNAQGFIVSNELTETNIKGVFAAGDVRHKLLKQVITAASDGAIAAKQAEAYLNETH